MNLFNLCFLFTICLTFNYVQLQLKPKLWLIRLRGSCPTSAEPRKEPPEWRLLKTKRKSCPCTEKQSTGGQFYRIASLSGRHFGSFFLRFHAASLQAKND